MDFPKFRTPKAVTYGKAGRRKVQGTTSPSKGTTRGSIEECEPESATSTGRHVSWPASRQGSPGDGIDELSLPDQATSFASNIARSKATSKASIPLTSARNTVSSRREKSRAEKCGPGSFDVYDFEDESRHTKRQKVSETRPSAAQARNIKHCDTRKDRSISQDIGHADDHKLEPPHTGLARLCPDQTTSPNSRREMRIEIPRRRPSSVLDHISSVSHISRSTRKSPKRQMLPSKADETNLSVAAPLLPAKASTAVVETEISRSRSKSSTTTNRLKGMPANIPSLSPYVPELPPASRLRSPDPSIPGIISPSRTTPRQTQLWDQLFEISHSKDEPSVQSPVKEKRRNSSGLSNADMDDLADIEQSGQINPDRLRRRLIDMLTPQGSFDESYIKESEDSHDEDENLRSPTAGRSPQRERSFSDPRISPSRNGSQIVNAKSEDRLEDKLSQSSVLVQYGGPRTTYSQQRSHLVEDDFLHEQLLDQDSPWSPAASRATKRQLPKYNTGQEKSMNGSPQKGKEKGLVGGPTRSIHELREAGVNRRFADEMGTLFEDIEDNGPHSMARKMAGLHTLLSKFSKRDFACRMADQDFDRRLLTCLKEESSGVIPQSLLSLAVLLLLRGTKSARTLGLVQDLEVINSVASLLDMGDDIVSVGGSGQMPKSAVQELVRIQELLHESSLWKSDRAIEPSPRMISLLCLDAIMRGGREAGSTECALSEQMTRNLMQLLVTNAQAFSAGVASEQHIIELEHSLVLLESFSLYEISSLRGLSRDKQATSLLATSISTLIKHDRSGNIVIMALRFLLNITNNDLAFCNALCDRSLIENLVHLVHSRLTSLSSTSMLDILVLALGILINFAELSDQARCYMIVAQLESERWLDASVQQFLARRAGIAEADSMDATHFNVVFGYLAVLLGNMCHNGTASASIRALMPHGSLQPLLDAVTEFLIYHKKVDTEMFGSENSPSEEMNFTTHLQQVADYLKSIM